MKRGVTKGPNAESKLLTYQMVTDLFDLETLKDAPNFGIKHYKDSHYIGEINPTSNQREG